MVGTNKMLLNDSTMRAALQEYFDRRYTEGVDAGPKVLGIVYCYDAAGMSYQVTLEGKKP